MTASPWIELSHTEPGLYQLAGTPVSNYNLLLYGKSLLARREGNTVFFIDNHGIIDQKKLQSDLEQKPELINGFYVFTPKNIQEFYSLVDDLDLMYFHTAQKPVVFISGIFEFLLKNPTNTKNMGLMAYILGLLRDFEVPVFVTNEMRATMEIDMPFLSHLLPPFFAKVFILEVKGKELDVLSYTF